MKNTNIKKIFLSCIERCTALVFLIEMLLGGSYLNFALRRCSQAVSSRLDGRTFVAFRVIWHNCYRATAHIVALFGHCDWNLNFIHRLVYIRPVTYSNRTVCIRASCPYVSSHHNTAAMLPIILISIAIIRPDWIRKVQTPSILQRDVFRAVKSNALELTCRAAIGVSIGIYGLDFLWQLNNVTKWVTNSNFTSEIRSLFILTTRFCTNSIAYYSMVVTNKRYMVLQRVPLILNSSCEIVAHDLRSSNTVGVESRIMVITPDV